MASEQGNTITLYGTEDFPGQALMDREVQRVVDWNREACRVQDEIGVCWLYPQEIEAQRSAA